MKETGIRYAQIPAAAVTDGRVKGLPFRLLCLLGRHVDKGGVCRRKQGLMAEELGVTRASVVRAVAALKRCGYVEAVAGYDSDGFRVSSSYRLIAPADQATLPLDESPRDSTVESSRDSTAESQCDSTVESSGDSAKNDPLLNVPSSLRSEGKPRGARPRKRDPDQRELIPVSLVPASPAPAKTPRRRYPGDDAAKGTRLQPLWEPTDLDRHRAIQHGLSPPEVDRQATLFRNYWLSKPGKDGRKVDWSRTFENWVLKEVQRKEERHAGTPRSAAPGAQGDRQRNARPDRLLDAARAAARRWEGKDR